MEVELATQLGESRLLLAVCLVIIVVLLWIIWRERRQPGSKARQTTGTSAAPVTPASQPAVNPLAAHPAGTATEPKASSAAAMEHFDPYMSVLTPMIFRSDAAGDNRHEV